MPEVQGIAFDLEGTVVDVEVAHHNAHFATAAEVRVEVNTDTAFQLLPHFIGGPDSKVMEDIYALSDKKVTPEELLERKKFHYERLLATMDIAPRPGFLKFLGAVRDLRLPVSIGSLTSMVQAKVLLERSGVGGLIGEANIVLAEHVKNHKPAPDVFLETARRMGIDPKNQLVFEDSPRGVQAAIAAGSKAIGMPVYNRLEATVPLLNAGVCRLFMGIGARSTPKRSFFTLAPSSNSSNNGHPILSDFKLRVWPPSLYQCSEKNFGVVIGGIRFTINNQPEVNRGNTRNSRARYLQASRIGP